MYCKDTVEYGIQELKQALKSTEQLGLEKQQQFLERMERLQQERALTMNETCCSFGSCTPSVSQPNSQGFYCDTYKVSEYIEKGIMNIQTSTKQFYGPILDLLLSF